MKHIPKKYQHYFHGDQESHHAGKAPGDPVWSQEWKGVCIFIPEIDKGLLLFLSPQITTSFFISSSKIWPYRYSDSIFRTETFLNFIFVLKLWVYFDTKLVKWNN